MVWCLVWLYCFGWGWLCQGRLTTEVRLPQLDWLRFALSLLRGGYASWKTYCHAPVLAPVTATPNMTSCDLGGVHLRKTMLLPDLGLMVARICSWGPQSHVLISLVVVSSKP